MPAIPYPRAWSGATACRRWVKDRIAFALHPPKRAARQIASTLPYCVFAYCGVIPAEAYFNCIQLRAREILEQDGELEFAGPAIMRAPSHARAEWAEKFEAMSIERPALKGLRRANKAK